MISLLTWNTKKRDLGRQLNTITQKYSPDLVVLTEGQDMGGFPSRNTRYTEVTAFYEPDSRIRLFTRTDRSILVKPLTGGQSRVRAFEVLTQQGIPILLFGVHLWDGWNNSLQKRAFKAQEVARIIQECELEQKNPNSLVIGDFNLSPYDYGLCMEGFLNARACRKEALRAEKIWSKAQDLCTRPFYNPSWALLGDIDRGPPGTFYSSSLDQKWNLLDQVLLRTGLMNSLRDIHIVQRVPNLNLCTREGLPNKDISDHLPLFLKLGTLK